MPVPLERIEMVERLKEHALAHAPGLVRRYRESESPAPVPPLREAQVLAVAVALDLDPGVPSRLREARRLLPLVEQAAAPEPVDRVAETAPVRIEPAIEQLSANQLAALRRALDWIASDPPAQWLARTSGIVAALDRTRRASPLFTEARACRWLEALGVPLLTPDPARRRVLERWGWITPGDKSADVLREVELFCHEAAMTPAQLALLLGALAGAVDDVPDDVATCRRKPRCPACVLADVCPSAVPENPDAVLEDRALLRLTANEQRPRERLARDGAEKLSEPELLAILLRTGKGGANAVDVANILLNQVEGDLDRLAAMSIAELAETPGVGEVKAVTLKAALELARRWHLKSTKSGRPPMTNGRLVFEHMRTRFIGQRQETFHVLLLNTKLELMREVQALQGTLNSTPIHPREIFSEAIRDRAHGVIFVHNHPSGDPAPSRMDISATRRLVEAGDLLGIRVIDHVIIAGESYYSFAEGGLLANTGDGGAAG